MALNAPFALMGTSSTKAAALNATILYQIAKHAHQLLTALLVQAISSMFKVDSVSAKLELIELPMIQLKRCVPAIQDSTQKTTRANSAMNSLTTVTSA